MKTALIAAALLLAQTTSSNPAFDVASIKRNRSGTLNSGIRNQPGGRVTVVNMTLRELVRSLHRLQSYQLVNNAGDWVSMERWDIAAKADRFSLMTHQEKRDSPIYRLVLARPNGATNTYNVFAEPGMLKMTCATLEALARNLAPIVQRMLVNQTNLARTFDLELTWSDTEGPSLFTALQEQLRLKLESDHAPVDVLVIDSAKRPTED